jgi:hypothetical protein
MPVGSGTFHAEPRRRTGPGCRVVPAYSRNETVVLAADPSDMEPGPSVELTKGNVSFSGYGPTTHSPVRPPPMTSSARSLIAAGS